MGHIGAFSLRRGCSADVFRVTVLEPITRFCAYFPDVNECKLTLPDFAQSNKCRHQETRPQTPRLRRPPRKSQETRRETRQGRDETPPGRTRNGHGEAGLRTTQRAAVDGAPAAHRPPRPVPGSELRGPRQDTAAFLRRGVQPDGTGAAVS